MKHALLATMAVVALVGCTREKGTSASYELDGKTLIVEETCPKNGRAFDYVTCGKTVRDKTKDILCARSGKGTHKYLYRTGKSKPMESSVYCKEG